MAQMGLYYSMSDPPQSSRVAPIPTARQVLGALNIGGEAELVTHLTANKPGKPGRGASAASGAADGRFVAESGKNRGLLPPRCVCSTGRSVAPRTKRAAKVKLNVES